ncbi:hypothetical protein [Mycobacterium sp.]|uniref:hypothetical protein n=1 Tax=Mycobacterium sp. TaxID=1785 RepID=UPI003D6BAC5A
MFFGFGSAVGAALAWLVGRNEPSRSTVVALNGTACGLLGVLTSASGHTTASAVEAGLGLLGTAAPLTLCMTPLRPIATCAAIPSAMRYLAATLALALVYGIGCATLGFVFMEGVRHISGKENSGKPMGYSIIMSRKPFHTLSL